MILQMPRGNFEIIYPRFLVLIQIIELIDERNYKKAWSLIIDHRIDPNFIVDYKWPHFLTQMKEFINQIKNGQVLIFTLLFFKK